MTLQPCPEGYPYRYVPVTAQVRDGKLYDIPTGEPVVVPEACNCDQGQDTCYFPECQEELMDILEERPEFADMYREAFDVSPLSVTVAVVDADGVIFTATDIEPADDELQAIRDYLEVRVLVPHAMVIEGAVAYYWTVPRRADMVRNAAASQLLGEPVYGPMAITNAMPQTPDVEMFRHYLMAPATPGDLGL